MKYLVLVFFSFVFIFSAEAQKPKSYHSGEIQQKLNKLSVLGSVLYIAAHPDDENTQLITYLANKELIRTAYLSTTRGDGGQNLVGPEIREGLGIIRTQELLAARRIDGGQQFFTRANDFGYSKNTEETLEVWDKKKVLEDYVKIIRTFRPDVIITRFRDLSGSTHGHHSSSATLAKEAYHLAADPTAYPDQLETLEIWQVKKLFWNTSRWQFRGTKDKMDTSVFQRIDVGGFDPLLGKSYTEIAALSRSQHKSQGFGAIGSRGSSSTYLKQWEGEASDEVFGGIDMTWDRVPDSEEVKNLLALAADSYDPAYPDETINALFNARAALLRMSDQFWKEIKLQEVDEVLRGIMGIYLEVIADDYSYVEGDTMQLKMEAIIRRSGDFKLAEVVLEPWGDTQVINQKMTNNKKITADFALVIPEMTSSTHPYWLNGGESVGMYHVENPELITRPENPPLFMSRFVLQWKDQYLEYEQSVNFRERDPVKGEVYRPIVVLPPATVKLSTDLMIFTEDQPKKLTVSVTASKDNVKGKVLWLHHGKWDFTSEKNDFELEQKGDEAIVELSLTPRQNADSDELTIKLWYDDQTTSQKRIQTISYDHLPIQTLLADATVELVRLDMKKAAEKIGYLMGAGDAIPENLRQVGYQVDLLSKDDITAQNLSQYDAVVLGIRAFNTLDWLKYKNEALFVYAEAGGTVIVQYTTTASLVTNELAPFPLKLSRDRVTVEEAPVQILDAKHQVMNYPNKISAEDFDGWVQERGLYFPDEWDENFQPILGSNDPGEEQKKGGLLIASYGKGYYVYTGYSWFRELPAGVTGAYRIYSNLLSLGKK